MDPTNPYQPPGAGCDGPKPPVLKPIWRRTIMVVAISVALVYVGWVCFSFASEVIDNFCWWFGLTD